MGIGSGKDRKRKDIKGNEWMSHANELIQDII